ncbi:MAG: hypothetical protein JXP73_05000 [Deltaproteobacteria bacterium]|jgi:hypothetical protein|nr:hypothetical protein [Deltaproteobacteria bacterium]
MNRPLDDLPEPLLAEGATDFERRLLGAAANERPSPEMSARMAQAIGASAAALGVAAVAKELAAEAVASKATAGVGATAVWPWIAAGVLGLAVAGTIIGVQSWKDSPTEPRPAASQTMAPAVAPPLPGSPAQGNVRAAEPSAGASVPAPRGRVAPAVGVLREQIALLDAARVAIADGSSGRALDLLRRYQERYPAGSFLPEAAALKVEALVKLGRNAEARRLAERFVADHRGTVLADRVSRIAGLVRP